MTVEAAEEFDGWLCDCGAREESFFHCRACGRQPPWGCDCGTHYENDLEEDPWEDWRL